MVTPRGGAARIRTVEVDGLTEPVPNLVAEGAATKAVDDLIAATTRCLGVRECLVDDPCAPSGNVFDHLDELVDGVSLRASELD